MAKGGIRGFVEVYLTRFIEFLDTNPHLKGTLLKVAGLFSSIIGPEGIQFVEDNATSIIIAFSLLLTICAIFLCCAYAIPRSKVEEFPEGEEVDQQVPVVEPVSPVSKASSEPDDQNPKSEGSGLRQRKGAQKKSRKED